MIYAQYSNQAEPDHIKKQRETAALLKEMKQWMDVLHLRLEIWLRNGASQGLRDGISEASREYGSRLERLMASSPARITGPTHR